MVFSSGILREKSKYILVILTQRASKSFSNYILFYGAGNTGTAWAVVFGALGSCKADMKHGDWWAIMFLW